MTSGLELWYLRGFWLFCWWKAVCFTRSCNIVKEKQQKQNRNKKWNFSGTLKAWLFLQLRIAKKRIMSLHKYYLIFKEANKTSITVSSSNMRLYSYRFGQQSVTWKYKVCYDISQSVVLKRLASLHQAWLSLLYFSNQITQSSPGCWLLLWQYCSWLTYSELLVLWSSKLSQDKDELCLLSQRAHYETQQMQWTQLETFIIFQSWSPPKRHML